MGLPVRRDQEQSEERGAFERNPLWQGRPAKLFHKGTIGGKVGIAPRLFVKKLVAGVLDPIELHPNFDPRRDFALTVAGSELTEIERNATRAGDVALDLP